MKPFPWKCPECGEKAIQPACEPRYETVMRHDGRDYRVAVQNLDLWKCEKCGLIQLPEPADALLQAELRNQAGLMPPELIRGTREELKLTQKQLADELQVAESTLSRWESGMQIQQRAMDQYLRLVFALKLSGEYKKYKMKSKKFIQKRIADVEGVKKTRQPQTGKIISRSSESKSLTKPSRVTT